MKYKSFTEQPEINSDSRKSAEQPAVNADSAFGRFGSAEQLLKAYNLLEAEFTKRSQKLRELQAAAAKPPREQPDSPAEFAERRQEQADSVAAEFAERRQEQADIPAAQANARRVPAPALIYAAAPALTPVRRPKTLAEAKELAERLLSR
ncbi:MAG: hypothetical protein LBP26_00690 [Clostridiales bacterium]|jgi:hypothetical protein|nr:hypothetical protein [Clostridiales bacterium]